MRLTLAQIEDAPLCARLIQDFYEHEPCMRPVDSTQAYAKALGILDAAARGHAHFILLHAGNDIAGYALMTHFFSCEYGGMVAILDEYLIVPQQQGRGLGGDFLPLIKQWAAAQGFTRVFLEVTAENPRVVALYERNGFHLLDRRLMACAV